MSKKDQLLKASSKIQQRENQPFLDKETMADKLKSPKSEYKRVLFTLEQFDIESLKETVKKVNQHTKRKTNKSELVRAGINILKDKTPTEILEILNSM